MPERPDPLLDLFVFPCVGGSAVVMYESWAALLPDFIQVRSLIHFAGRPRLTPGAKAKARLRCQQTEEDTQGALDESREDQTAQAPMSEA
jgi:surfactin synthase thioesterase subunit